MGTINVFECARSYSSVKAVINVTSDKCYAPHEGGAPYRESDALGGNDPYSGSKACAEIVTSAYRNSFFTAERSSRVVGLASVRAGNVIGGGDWAADRLVPDCVRAFSKSEPVPVRNPDATRPWQHVLDAIRGYLIVAQNLYKDPSTYSEAYNFGPHPHDTKTVSDLLSEIKKRWGGDVSWIKDEGKHPPEAPTLSLDSSYAQAKLGWKPLLSLAQALDLTVSWYKTSLTGGKMTKLSVAHLQQMEALEKA
jgi:CDP-glucose 4,6-dehydratase